ncbi:MAG: bifunctional phosphopantothenoylcysteine decarboxylase/phosphopantothenate--cysteine ligase CoaBC [Pelagibacterales bacterium]|nr:bifunctional phosphopantothenoylcysteine decarboxylase/phosphopantothenate--cysteine ligase CoaBC [Pelagibacterales bacterium]
MKNLNGKKILLIICGGIAAYKSLEVIRLLKKNGSSVKTILTNNAKKFITPLSVASLSQEKVYTDLFNSDNESEMDHISLSRWSDLILIAPATANTISKISFGLSDDLASTVVFASDKKIFIAPAMNVRMWEHQSNKENLEKLIDFGHEIIGPETGEMACGEYGMGKMSEPVTIINHINNYFKKLENNKKFKALVTAGPTHEYIDPVRFISNKSSGKQGYEIARSLSENGFDTTLISGPTNLNQIKGVNLIKVKSADEMLEATLNNLPTDVAIFSAAVADFKVKNKEKEKIKKNKISELSLEKNTDILGHISNHNSLRPKLVVGFAAETNSLKNNSLKKLSEKNCDWIIANDISKNDIGFESDFNKVSIFYKNNSEENLPKMRKSSLANEIVNRIISQLN